jgi:mRNA-degrading endonuclease RelE of RelBE toxin-antitoxin system
VLQIVFNEISAAEISRMDTLDQLELLDAFRVSESDLVELDDNDEHRNFGKIARDGKTLYRFRANDCRIYFEVAEDLVIVHRVLHKNTFSDFLFRSKMPVSEDEQLAESKHFWKLIDEGRNARRME